MRLRKLSCSSFTFVQVFLQAWSVFHCFSNIVDLCFEANPKFHILAKNPKKDYQKAEKLFLSSTLNDNLLNDISWVSTGSNFHLALSLSRHETYMADCLSQRKRNVTHLDLKIMKPFSPVFRTQTASLCWRFETLIYCTVLHRIKIVVRHKKSL